MTATGIVLVVGLGLTVVALSTVLYFVVQQNEDMEDDRQDFRVRLARAGAELSQRRDQEDRFAERVDSLMARHHEEEQVWKDERERLNGRIDELMHQNQNLAERVASLRKEGLPEGGDDFHVEDVEPEPPLSADLEKHLSGIESPEAQEIERQRIDRMRARGVEDEQILRELDEEGTVL